VNDKIYSRHLWPIGDLVKAESAMTQNSDPLYKAFSLRPLSKSDFYNEKLQGYTPHYTYFISESIQYHVNTL